MRRTGIVINLYGQRRFLLQQTRLVVLCLGLLALAPAPASAAVAPVNRDEHLPTPEGLEAEVSFWENVFGKYAPDECVFHDKDNLGAIYAVKRIPGVSQQAQAQQVKHYLGAIRTAFAHLATGAEPLSLLERRIEQVTEPRLRYTAYYRFAMDNVRCQRGVDLSDGLTRSRTHIRMVKRVLAKVGLPTDLAYLPYLESGYNPEARSRAGARGLWQLMPATARLNGLSVSRHIDHRTNPYKATLAAAAMLKQFFDRTESWPLAITAYNYGINGMTRAIKLYGNDYMTVRLLHHTRIFGFAAKNYYPSFLAIRNVAAAAEREIAAASTGVAMDHPAPPGAKRL